MRFFSSNLSAFRKFSGKRSSQTTTAVADAVLLLSLSAVCFPEARWTCPLAVLIALLPLWINAFAAQRKIRESVFVPDPVSPDFQSFADSFLASAGQIATGEKDKNIWTLCPMCKQDGNSQPYSLDFFPAKKTLFIVCGNSTLKFTTEIVFRSRLALPITVTDIPMKIRLSQANQPKQVFLTENKPARLFWNRPYGNTMRTELLKGILSVALLTHAIFPESTVLNTERLAILAVLLIFALFKVR